MDVEAILIAWFDIHASVQTFDEVPEEGEKPQSFLTVERTGGFTGKDGIEHAMVAVQCWAQSLADAAMLSREVSSLAGDLDDEPFVSECSVNSIHRHPTAQNEPRYQVVIDVAVYI